MKMQTKLLAAVVPVVSLMVSMPAAHGAVTSTWSVDGTNNWNASASWGSTNIPKVIGDEADLTRNLSAIATATLDTNISLGTLKIGDSGAGNGTFAYTLTRTSTNVLTMNNGASHATIQQLATAGADVISTPITLSSDLDVFSSGSGKTLALTGTITTNSRAINIGNTGLTNAGTVSISNSTPFTGSPAVTVYSGAFNISTRTGGLASLTVNSGASAAGGSFIIGGSGALTLNGNMTSSFTTSTNGMTIGSGVTANISNVTSFLKGNVTYSGGSGATITGNGAGRLIDLNGAVRTFDVADGSSAVDLTIGATATNTVNLNNGGVTKTGAGVMQLNALTGVTFGYSGATTVSVGTLKLVNTGSTTRNLIPNSTTITVADGAKFDVSGVAGNTFALASGQTVRATGDGTATVVGSLDAATNSSILDLADLTTISTLKITSDGTAVKLSNTALKFDLGTTLGSNDLISARNLADTAAGSVNATGATNTITITALTGATSLASGDYTLMTASGGLGTSAFALASPTIVVGGKTYDLSLSKSSSKAEILTVSIPEPSTIAAVGGVIGLLGLRRRHRA